MRLWRTALKLTASVSVVTFLSIIVNVAHAQEASVALTAGTVTDQLPKTPTLVVHEIVIPQAIVKPGTAVPKTQDAPAKNAAAKSPAASASSVTSTSQPLVLPAATEPVRGNLVTTGNPKYDGLIATSAARNGVDPNLITAVMRQESGFHAGARSYKGATGLMQLMPATAARFGVTVTNTPGVSATVDEGGQPRQIL